MTSLLLNKLSKELTLKQVWKDGIWLQMQIAAKRLSRLQIHYLKIHEKLLEEVYPDNWDFNVVVNSSCNNLVESNTKNGIWYKQISGNKETPGKLYIEFYPVIKFDNFHIKNTRKQSLLLRNIFVELKTTTYKYNKYYLTDFRGTRNIVSYNEYSNSYLHSHLPQVDMKEYGLYYQHFCTGSGEINFMMSKLMFNFNENLFKTLLFHIQGYLEWESLEGKPHICLKDLFIKNKNEGIAYLSQGKIQEITDKIIKHQSERYNSYNKNHVKLDWYIDSANNLYKIKDNDKLEEYCRYYSSRELYNQSNICFKDELNNYYPINSKVENVVTNQDAYLPFQGVKNKMIVEGLLDTTDKQYYIHPKIKLNVKRQLENTINKRAIKISAINAL